MTRFAYLFILLAVLVPWLQKERVFRILDRILEAPSYKRVIKPTLIAFPSAAILCYQIPLIKTHLPQFIWTWLEKHVILLAGIYLLLPIFVGLEDFIREKARIYSDILPPDGQSLLLKALDYPVLKKMDRFLSALRPSKLNKFQSAGDIFREITQPDRQLAEIIRSIHNFFEALAALQNMPDANFRTVLFKMARKIPVESWCCFPESELPVQGIIYDKTCLASHAVKRKKMIIIEDIKKEKKSMRSRVSRYCESEEGSALCYPIECRHINTIPLAIRIVSDKPFFKSSAKNLYEEILERFKYRILIEYGLSQLKNYTREKGC